MKHLYIKQNNNVEIVSSDIIEKLYQISQGGLYSTSDLIGNLQCTHAYDDAVTYLTTKFKNLQINVTDGSYIRFADSAVASICATNWGDGTGITTVQASVVASLNSKFNANAAIISFNELAKFINVKTLINDEFSGCSKLQSIDLSNIMALGRSAFQDCSLLASVGDCSGVTSIGGSAFYGCTSLLFIIINNSNTPAIGSQVFDNSFPFIYVPSDVRTLYIQAVNWSSIKYLIGSINDYANINEPTLTSGYYLSSGNKLVVNTAYAVTDYIAVPANTSLTFIHRMAQEGNACFLEYDSNKTQVDNWVGENMIRTITTHSNTAYVRMSINVNQISRGYAIFNNDNNTYIMKVNPLMT